jgi:ATP-dependent helicase/nuclease subunit B
MRDIAGVLEVATSTQALRARRRNVFERAENGVLLGHHFLTLNGLAEQCAAETGTPVRGELRGIAWVRLVRHCAGSVQRFRELVRAQPRIATALASTLRDLRDAGVSPSDLPNELSDLRELFADTEAALEGLEKSAALYDRIGLFRLAQRGVEAWVRRVNIRQASVYGATELVGSQGDLLQSIDDTIPLVLHQADPGDPHAAAVRERWPWSFRVTPGPVAPDPAVPRQGRVRDGALRVLPVPGGPLEELERVAAEVLALLDRGIPPRDIAVVARTLEPYASWIEPIFARYGIPFSSSLSEPALLHPAGKRLLHLARVLLGDFDAPAFVELLRVPGLRWRPSPLRGVPELAERLARVAGITGGLESWRTAVRGAPNLLDRRGAGQVPEASETLLRILGALRADAERVREARGWKASVGAFFEALDRWIPEAGADGDEKVALDRIAAEAVRTALRELIMLDPVAGTTTGLEAPSSAERLRAIEETLGSASVRPHGRDARNVLVLDAVQARAVPIPHLFLIGMNETFWPRSLEEDPFLPDDVRTRLRDTLRRPVPVRGQTESEERFLFTLLLSQASESVAATFHRADGSGRASAPSPYLRELISRTPDPEALRKRIYDAQGDGASGAASPEGAVPLRVALVETALREGADSLTTLTRQLPADEARTIERGLDHLRVVESVSTADLRFDGAVGGESVVEQYPFRPTRLEAVGKCPLRGFFRDVLAVPEHAEGSATELQANEVGNVVHQLLETVYTDLDKAGLLQRGTRPEEAFRVAREALANDLSKRPLPPTGDPFGTALRDGLRSQLQRSLEEFIEWDLARLLPEGVSEILCEESFEEEIDLGGEPLALRGKIDRWLRSSKGVQVSDYKTGGSPDKGVRGAEVLAGRALQLPLYVVRVGEKTRASEVQGEVLHVPLRPDRSMGRGRERSFRLEEAAVERLREKITRPVQTLTRLLRDGQFPLRHGDHCRHCPYAVACRHTHLPTVARVRDAEAFRGYFEIAGEPQ